MHENIWEKLENYLQQRILDYSPPTPKLEENPSFKRKLDRNPDRSIIADQWPGYPRARVPISPGAQQPEYPTAYVHNLFGSKFSRDEKNKIENVDDVIQEDIPENEIEQDSVS